MKEKISCHLEWRRGERGRGPLGTKNIFILVLIIFQFLFRYGRVQSVKILSKKSDDVGDGSEAATVAFMDIKSANFAFNSEHKFDDRVLRTNYYDPSPYDSATGSVQVQLHLFTV